MEKLKMSKDIQLNNNYMSKNLGIGVNFDVAHRKFSILDTDIYMYTINGLIDSMLTTEIIQSLLKVRELEENIESNDLANVIENNLVNMQVTRSTELNELVINVMTGCMVILVDGYEQGFIIDTRGYPTRAPEEAQNEPSVRGSQDGFVENIIINTTLVRRRIRHPKLRYEILKVGEISQLDVVICYMEDRANKIIIDEIKNKLQTTSVKELTNGNQAIHEILFPNKKNPLPYTKLTERPDVFAAELTKGYIGILSDNNRNGIILPVTLFDLFGHVAQHQHEPFVSSMYRIINFIYILSILTLIPIWYYFSFNPEVLPDSVSYLKIPEEYEVPAIAQIGFLQLLYMLMVITHFTTPKIFRPAIIFSTSIIISAAGVESKLLSPHAVLIVLIGYLLVKSLFTDEVQFAFTFFAIMQTIATYFFGLYGLIGSLILLFVFLATRKVFGRYYLYPLIPLNIKKLLKYIFRYRKSK